MLQSGGLSVGQRRHGKLTAKHCACAGNNAHALCQRPTFYVYFDMHIYEKVYVYIHIPQYTYLYIYKYTYIYIYIYTAVDLYVPIYTHIVYILKYIYTYTSFPKCVECHSKKCVSNVNAKFVDWVL